MKHRVSPLVENIAESATACLVTMVQGNMLALSLTHWMIASRTGVIAGAVASAAILVAGTQHRWAISAILGTVTGIVDYFVHPGQFGPVAMEAVVTGLGAGLLSALAGAAVRRARARAKARAELT